MRLREQLEKDSPELYSALMRSWAIAEREWLPALSGNKGSFNSLPHLRNLEHHLDDILCQSREAYPESRALEMIPIEKYMMLAAILFHDIGRTLHGKWHAHNSRNLIRKNFADLGIESKTIAKILGDICCFHDCSREMEDDLDLRDHAVTPYGVIHCRTIAHLLKLVDNLDTAYNRVLPHYLHQDEGSIIENFRRNTLGVRVDLRHQMIVTSVGLESRDLIPSQRLEGGTVVPPLFCPEGEVAYMESSGTKASRDETSQCWHCWSEVNIVPNPEYAFSQKALDACQSLWQLVEYTSVRKGHRRALRGLAGGFTACLSAINRCIKGPALKGLPHFAALKRILQGKSRSVGRWHIYLRENRGPLEREISTLFEKVTRGISDQSIRDLLHGRGVGVQISPEKVIPFWVAEKDASYVPLMALPHGNTPSSKIEPRQRVVPYMIMRKIVFPVFPENSGVTNLSRILFLVIAGTVRSSARLLADQLRDPLSILSIPIKAWLLEYDEHLFTCAGRETFEPSLDKGLLREVVEAMWHLSAGMFGRVPCSFHTLAASLRISDIDLVRTAVRRVAIVTRHRRDAPPDVSHPSSRSCYAIMFTRNDWRWCSQEEGCSYKIDGGTAVRNKHSQGWILEQIDRLAEPDGDI
jgi:hypothetical protein